MLTLEDALLLKISGYLVKRQSPVNKTDEAGSRLTHLITRSMDTKVHRRVDGHDTQASTMPCSSSSRQNNHSAKTNLPSTIFEMAVGARAAVTDGAARDDAPHVLDPVVPLECTGAFLPGLGGSRAKTDQTPPNPGLLTRGMPRTLLVVTRPHYSWVTNSPPTTLDTATVPVPQLPLASQLITPDRP